MPDVLRTLVQSLQPPRKEVNIFNYSQFVATKIARFTILVSGLLLLVACGNDTASEQVEIDVSVQPQQVAVQTSNVAPAKPFDIYTTLGSEQQQPLSEREDIFECESTVYTVIEMFGTDPGKHQLEVDWFDPSQSKRETTRYDFTVTNSQERIWAWLRLHRASGGGMMKWLDSSAGLEEFVGDWLVEVKIDGRNIGQTSFRVIC